MSIKKNKFYLIPIVLFIFVVPFIVKMKIVSLPNMNLSFRPDYDTNVNFFTYYKGILIILSSIFSFGIFFYKFILGNNRLKKDKYKIMIGASMIFVIVTTLLSKYKFIAMWGEIDRAEGIFVLISYLFMVIYIGEFIKKKEDHKILLYGFAISSLILGVIGLLQMQGKDIFSMPFFQNLYLTSDYSIEDITLNFSKRTYMTLFNPNYVGTYVTLIIGIFLNVLIRNKKLIIKVISGLIIILMSINLFGSFSKAGFVGVFLTLISTALINYKIIYKHRKKSIIFLIVLIIASGAIYTNFKSHVLVKSIEGTISSFGNKIETPLDSIVTKSKSLEIEYNDEKLYFAPVPNTPSKFFFFDSDQELLEYDINDNVLRLKDERYKSITAQYMEFQEQPGYRIIFDGRKYDFINHERGILYLNSYSQATNLGEVDYVKALEGYEHLGSGRVFIWSRSIPLLKKTWLVGFGPDHFTYNFPQTDYVGKNMRNMRMVNTVVDKPHNMYLQYAINIGVVPLLILLTFWGMLLFELFKIVQKEELDDIYLTVAAAAFSSIIGFMAVGMFNDSTVNVSSIFWGIVGLGLAVVNYNRYDHIRFKEEN